MESIVTSQKSGMNCWPTTRIGKVSSCEGACPIRMNIPGFVVSIARREFDEAYEIMRESNPFPGVCGYVCPHPCEEACVRAKIDEPIAIKSLRRFVVDYKFSQGMKKAGSVEKTRDKVAIVGSGPAGLTCAHDLAMCGYNVRVYEAKSVPGGMLTTAIPKFILPRKIIENEINLICDLGIEIQTNVHIGKDFSIGEIMQQGYKAVFLAVGTTQNMKLNIPGHELNGVFYALPFLENINRNKKVKIGPKVVVIGGGNVAIDAARTAIRLGAKEVQIVCLESRKEMPAFDWEIKEAENEGIKINCSRAPRRIIGEDGKVAGLNCVRVKAIDFDAEGRIKPLLIEDSEYFFEANSLIIGIGQSLDPSFLAGMKGLGISRKGTVTADPANLATTVPGVFAGGDATSGRGTVVEAIASGHKAAVSIDSFLSGKGLKEPATTEVMDVEEMRLPRFVEQRKRVRMPKRPAKERVGSFREVELGLFEEAAVKEAKRCLSCPICGNCIFDRSQMCHETASRLL